VQDQPFKPPGVLQHKYEVSKRQYGVWKASLSEADTKKIIRNCQILVLLFIEGASMIEINDLDWTISRWTVFFL
jgi:histone acetyltransferase 1